MEKNICFSLKNQIEKPREYWVDIARGIGIILVMFAHSPIARNFALYTYVFNMPMFFFLSGYFVNILKYKNYFGYLKNLAKKIMVPYFWFSLISIVFYVFYHNMPYYDYFTQRAMLKVFFTATRNTIFYNVPLWFLPTLFFAANAFYFVKKINKKWLEIALILSLGGLFVMLWDTIYQPKLFWTIDSGFYYLIFFGMGYYLKNNLIKFRLNKKWLKYVCLAIAVFFNTLVIFMPKFYSLVFKSDMIANFRLLYFLLNILMAFSGIFVVFEFSKWIKRNRILEYLGKHSLNYFALHVLVFLILNKIIKPIELLSQNLTVLSIIYVLITIVALVPVNWFVSKKLPKILTK